jgi:hypothetical protein
MVSSEVQRTLVKSPPELWAEISDPESLARHLGEFGEIRITRVQPEQKVEWEADDAHGSVVIKPSGWGTKVKLTVTRQLPPPGDADAPADAEPGAAEDDVESKPDATADASAQSELDIQPAAAIHFDAELHPEAGAQPDPLDALLDDELPPADAEPADAASAEAEHDEAQPAGEPPHDVEPAREPRRGFFARLFGHRRTARPKPREAFEAAALVTGGGDAPAESSSHDDRALAGDELADKPARPFEEAAASPELALASELQPSAEPADEHDAQSAAAHEAGAEAASAGGEPVAEAVDEPAVDIAAELRAAEEAAAEQVTAVLSGVLDRLGAAHHRPFSRS